MQSLIHNASLHVGKAIQTDDFPDNNLLTFREPRLCVYELIVSDAIGADDIIRTAKHIKSDVTITLPQDVCLRAQPINNNFHEEKAHVIVSSTEMKVMSWFPREALEDCCRSSWETWASRWAANHPAPAPAPNATN